MLQVVNLKKRIDLAKKYSNDNLRTSFKIGEFLSHTETSNHSHSPSQQFIHLDKSTRLSKASKI